MLRKPGALIYASMFVLAGFAPIAADAAAQNCESLTHELVLPSPIVYEQSLLVRAAEEKCVQELNRLHGSSCVSSGFSYIYVPNVSPSRLSEIRCRGGTPQSLWQRFWGPGGKKK